jgi:hypothetical protein
VKIFTKHKQRGQVGLKQVRQALTVVKQMVVQATILWKMHSLRK